jgi:hypothetical protein
LELLAIVVGASAVDDLEGVGAGGNVANGDGGGGTSGRGGQGLDGVEVAAGTALEENGAASLAAGVLEGEWLASDDIELGVEESWLGGNSGGESENGSRVLHFDGSLFWLVGWFVCVW